MCVLLHYTLSHAVPLKGFRPVRHIPMGSATCQALARGLRGHKTRRGRHASFTSLQPPCQQLHTPAMAAAASLSVQEMAAGVGRRLRPALRCSAGSFGLQGRTTVVPTTSSPNLQPHCMHLPSARCLCTRHGAAGQETTDGQPSRCRSHRHPGTQKAA